MLSHITINKALTILYAGMLYAMSLQWVIPHQPTRLLADYLLKTDLFLLILPGDCQGTIILSF